MSCKNGEGGDARGGDDFVHGDGSCGVPVVDGDVPADGGVPVVEAIPVVDGGPLTRPQAVSREFIEAELERWSDLLERLGNC